MVWRIAVVAEEHLIVLQPLHAQVLQCAELSNPTAQPQSGGRLFVSAPKLHEAGKSPADPAGE